MDHLLMPLERLRAKAAAFLRHDRCPLLIVQPDQELAGEAVKTLLALEYHPDNVRNVVLLDGDARLGRAPWNVWTQGLPVVYAAIREAHDVGHPSEVDDLGPIDGFREQSQLPPGVRQFAGRLGQLLAVLSAAPFSQEGLLIVVSISGEYDKESFADELGALLDVSALASARWIWVESFGTADPGRLRGRSESLLVQVDADAAAAFQRAALEGIDGPTPIAGEAWPDLPTPWHPSQPQLGQLPAGGSGSVVTTALLKAAKAFGDGQIPKAVELLRGARDAPLGADDVGLGLELDLLTNVGRAQQGGQELSAAIGELGRTADRARNEQLWLTAAKVEIALAGLASSVQDYALSALSYRKAADAAKAGGFVALAIEALYLGGEIALAGAQILKMEALEHTAIGVWQEAFDLATGMPPAEAAGTRLEELRARLATLLRKHGLEADAARIEARIADNGISARQRTLN